MENTSTREIEASLQNEKKIVPLPKIMETFSFAVPLPQIHANGDLRSHVPNIQHPSPDATRDQKHEATRHDRRRRRPLQEQIPELRLFTLN